jgi:hypothetical protein
MLPASLPSLQARRYCNHVEITPVSRLPRSLYTHSSRSFSRQAKESKQIFGTSQKARPFIITEFVSSHRDPLPRLGLSTAAHPETCTVKIDAQMLYRRAAPLSKNKCGRGWWRVFDPAPRGYRIAGAFHVQTRFSLPSLPANQEQNRKNMT